MELVKDLTLDVLLSLTIGRAMGLVLFFLKDRFDSMDWATIVLTNLFVLLSVHVSVKVMVRYRMVALAMIPAVMLCQFPWAFGLLFQVVQLAMYTLS